jgi:hypothetical protein
VVTADVVNTAIKNVKNQQILVEVTTCNPIDLQDICTAAKHFSGTDDRPLRPYQENTDVT